MRQRTRLRVAQANRDLLDALKEGIIVSDGLSTLAPMLSSEDVELKRLSAAIVMDVSQYCTMAPLDAVSPSPRANH